MKVYCILHHSFWSDGIFVSKYARLNEKLINPILHGLFLANFCTRHNSAANGPIFKIFFCLKDLEKFLLKIDDRTS